MSSRQLTLVIPRLLPEFYQHAEIKLPALHKLMARTVTATSTVSQSNEKLLFSLFGYPPAVPANASEVAELPVAAVTGLADGLNTHENYWLRADPVEFRADLAAVYLLGNDHLLPEKYPATNQLQQLQQFLTLDDLQFYPLHPQRWYLESTTDPQILTATPAEVQLKNIFPYLPRGDKQAYWQKIFTEMQMFLHNTHLASNIQGQSMTGVINGVWIWGAGKLPQPFPVSWHKIWSNDPLVKGLAILAQVIRMDLPLHFASCLTQMETGRYLITMDQNMDAEVLQRLEQNWFAPLVQALRKNQLSSLDLYIGVGQHYHITARSIYYFWRRGVK